MTQGFAVEVGKLLRGSFPTTYAPFVLCKNEPTVKHTKIRLYRTQIENPKSNTCFSDKYFSELTESKSESISL